MEFLEKFEEYKRIAESCYNLYNRDENGIKTKIDNLYSLTNTDFSLYENLEYGLCGEELFEMVIKFQQPQYRHNIVIDNSSKEEETAEYNRKNGDFEFIGGVLKGDKIDIKLRAKAQTTYGDNCFYPFVFKNSILSFGQNENGYYILFSNDFKHFCFLSAKNAIKYIEDKHIDNLCFNDIKNLCISNHAYSYDFEKNRFDFIQQPLKELKSKYYIDESDIINNLNADGKIKIIDENTNTPYIFNYKNFMKLNQKIIDLFLYPMRKNNENRKSLWIRKDYPGNFDYSIKFNDGLLLKDLKDLMDFNY